MGKNSMDKRKAKAMQKGIQKLQVELSREIMGIFQSASTPLDINEIVANYPDNERKASCDTMTLKKYVSIGLGYMIEQQLIKELPQDEHGQWKLALIKDV